MVKLSFLDDQLLFPVPQKENFVPTIKITAVSAIAFFTRTQINHDRANPIKLSRYLFLSRLSPW